MAVNIVTGMTGTAHITSDDDRCFNASIIGKGEYVFDYGKKFSVDIINNNLIRVHDGMCIIQGTQMGIELNDYEDVVIENGISGSIRKDLIVMRYERNADTSIEKASLVVIKGEPVTNDGQTQPVQPQPTSGNILDGGDLIVDIPLYYVTIESLSIAKVEPLFVVFDLQKKFLDSIEIGGRNMCIGTNQGTRNWEWSMGTGTYTKEEVLEDGIRTCKITRNNDTHTGWSFIYFTDIGRDKWLPNTDYTVSIDVKASVDTFFRIDFMKKNGANSLISKRSVKNNTTRANEWVTLQWLCKSNSSLPTETDQVMYLSGMNSDTEVSYQFRNLKLEKGNTATDWTPAPEDIEEEIQKVDNKLTTNLMKSILSTSTKNGITCTNNGDGTYTLTGTSTGKTNFVLATNIIKNKLSKNLPLKLLGGISNNVYVAYVNINDEDKSIVDKGTGAIINDVIDNGLLSITILAGETLPNIVVKPMLTTNLNATYDDFVQYTGDSGKLNGDVAELLNNLGNASYKDVSTSVVSGDSNLVTGDAVSKAIFTATNYEEGTWTPNFYRDETHAIGTNVAYGVYYKIGKLVYIRGYIVLQESSPCFSIKGIPLAIRVDVSIPLKNLLSVSISKSDSNVLNVGDAGITEIKNIGYDASYNAKEWIIEGWYVTV